MSEFFEKKFVVGFVFSDFAEKLKMNYKVNSVTGTFKDFVYNLGHNILVLLDVLLNFSFATSETNHDY